MRETKQYFQKLNNVLIAKGKIDCTGWNGLQK